MEFGREFREAHFCFDKKIVPLNHGSFGAIPDSVFKAQSEALGRVLADKERFYLRDLFQDLPEFRKVVGSVLDASPDNVAFVTNATTGVNTVLRSWPFQPGDKILYTNVIYGSCGNTVKFLELRSGVQGVKVEIDLKMSQDDIVKAIEKAIDAEKPKMAIFDTVSSLPAINVPWERLVELCREKDVLSLVDGAHGIGLIPISLNTVKPDFFTTNLHKWFYTPNSCAVLYVDPKHFRHVHTMPISHSFVRDDVSVPDESKRFVDRFDFTGTIDYSAAYSIPAAWKFITDECGGIQKVQAYCNELAEKAGKMIAQDFGTEYVSGQGIAMINVRVPVDIPEDLQREAVDFMLDYQLHHANTYVHLTPHNGQIWSRWSAQIYLELEDFKHGMKSIRDAIKAWGNKPPSHKTRSFLNSVEED